MTRHRVALGVAILASSLLAGVAAAEPPAPEAFRQCAGCHSGKPDALGPDLNHVVGRPAATVPDFRYSGPLKRSGIVWTPERLKAFLIDPQSVVPGNRMPFSGTSPAVAETITAYLTAAASNSRRK